MRVFITGLTGFVGGLVAQRLLRDGHQVVGWVRNLDKARQTADPRATLLPTDASPEELCAVLTSVDGVVNLAGENIFRGRWSSRRKRALRTSRIETTERLVDAMIGARIRPKVLVSASAVGYYGHRGDELLDETSAPGTGFLAELCLDWERAAAKAAAHDVRTAIFRIGIVLGAGGGAMEALLPLFRLGLGARLASGRQWLSWVHGVDLAEMVCAALVDKDVRGVFNATAPKPVTNRDLTQNLASAVRRPSVLSAPAFLLRLGLGEAGDVLLGSQRALPIELQRIGFQFSFPQLDDALSDLMAAQDPSGALRQGPAEIERTSPR